MKVLTACIAASLCGWVGHWLLQWQQDIARWAGLESDMDIKAGGTD